jgi:hypothetical protein
MKYILFLFLAFVTFVLWCFLKVSSDSDKILDKTTKNKD